MKPNQNSQRLVRQLLICTAISAICHNVYAEDSPFADRPLSLIDEFSTKPEYDVGKPSVMLLIDDSYSMNAEVGLRENEMTDQNTCKDDYTYFVSTATNRLTTETLIRQYAARVGHEEKTIPTLGCRKILKDENQTVNNRMVLGSINGLSSYPSRTYSGQTLAYYYKNKYQFRIPKVQKSDNLYTSYDPDYFYKALTGVNNYAIKAWEYFRNIPSDGTRATITQAALKKVLTKYGDKLEWNMLSLWGSENLDKSGCANDFKNPAEYDYGGANAILNKLPTLFGDSYYYRPGFYDLAKAYLEEPRYLFTKTEQDYAKLKDRQHCTQLYYDLNEYITPVISGATDSYRQASVDSNRSTPLVWRYLQAGKKVSEYVLAQNKSLDDKAKQCRNDFIIVFADGAPVNLFPQFDSGISNGDLSKLKYNLANNVNLYDSFSGKKIDHTGTASLDGISYFSDKLFNTGDKLGGSKIQTFSIGFGEGLSDAGRQILVNAAKALKPGEDTLPVATGSGSTLKKYGYWDAKNADDLDKAFEEIFQNILAQSATNAEETGSTASPGVLSSSSLGAAVLTLNTGNWSSGLKFFQLDAEGNVAGTDTTEPDYSSRKVIMNNGTTNYYLDAPIATANEDFLFANKEEFSGVFLPWLRRDGNSDTALIDKAKTVAAPKKIAEYRNRLATVKMNDGSQYTPTTQDREMSDVLAAPIIGIKDKSNQYLVTGANDGMVYIFGGSSSALPSTLKLNYLPGSMPRESATDTLAANLYQIAEEGYGRNDKKHIYGVNGGISYVKTAATKDRQQQILLLGSMGQGGRGVYALNIDGCDQTKSTCEAVGLGASDSSWLTSVPRWEAKAQTTGDVKLGYTVGSPVLYQMATTFSTKDGKKSANLDTGIYLAGFVGNGFPGKTDALAADDKPTLYIFDAMGVDQGTSGGSATTSKKGSLIKKISVTGSSNTGLLNGLKGQNTLAPPAVIDIDFDGIADLAYAGDYAGNLYRFDFRDGIANAKGVKIYAGESTQPITAAPAIYRESDTKLIVTFGTGSDLFDADLKDKDNQQGFFGIFDDISVASPSAVSRSSLIQQTLSGTTTRTLTDEKSVSLAKDKGWWIPLAEGSFVSTATKDTLTAAEKSVTQPQLLLSTAFFSTLVYQYEETNKENIGSKQCPVNKSGKKSGGSGWLMAIDVKTGGMPKTAKFKSTQNKDKAGLKLNNLISGAVLLDGDVATEMPSALNANGQAQNGELKELHTPPKPLNNTCLTSDANFILLSEVKKGGGVLSEAVTGPLCPDPGMLIRLNLRELDNEQ